METKGLELLKRFESCKLKAYKDTNGKWAIGYGHTKDVYEGQEITINEANRLLNNDLKFFEEEVDKYVKSNINVNQRSALICLCYNIGSGAFKDSTLLKEVNRDPTKRNRSNIEEGFRKFVYADHKKINGLVRRREAEIELYFKDPRAGADSTSSAISNEELLQNNQVQTNSHNLTPEPENIDENAFIENIASAYGVSNEEALRILNDSNIGDVTTNLQRPARRLIYVEPNDVNGHINGVTVTPDYTDYCIYFNLIAEKVSRITSGAEGLNKTETMAISWRSQLDNNELNEVHYLSGDNVGLNDFLTTYYTDIHFNDIKENQIVEGLGVSNVNITFESYFTPKISIKFVDVRGSGMFGSEESVHSTHDGHISQDTVFSSFFTFPYPKFSLVVKGFYGKPVTYQLACSDFRATFNSESGNFEADATFIGYQYSILTDIPMSFIAAAPYCKYYGEEYWNQKVLSPEWAMDNGSQPIKLKELMHNISSALDTVDNENSEEQLDSGASNERIRRIQEVKDKISDYQRLVNQMYSDMISSGHTYSLITHDKKEMIFIKKDESEYAVNPIFGISDYFDKFKELLLSIKEIITDEEYNDLLNFLPCWYINGENEVECDAISIKEILQGDDNQEFTVDNYGRISYNNSSNNATYDFVNKLDEKLRERKINTIWTNKSFNISIELKRMVINFINNEINQSSERIIIDENRYTNVLKYELYGYNENGFVEKLKSFISDDIDEEFLSNRRNKRYKSIENILNINFKPYIGNIYKLIMCHLETFTEIIFQCVDIIRNQINNGDRTPNKLGINLNSTNVPNNILNTVPPFPQIWNNGISNNNSGVIDNNYDFIGWPGDFSGDGIEEWQEEKLIKELVRSIKITTINNNLNENIEINQENEINNLPVFHFDLLNQNNIIEPGLIENNNSSNYMSGLAGYLALRELEMIYFKADNNDFIIDEDLIKSFANFEVLRIYKTLGGYSRFKEYFSENGVDNITGLTDKCLNLIKTNDKKNAYNYLVSGYKPIINSNYDYDYFKYKNNSFTIDVIPCNIKKYKDIKKFYDYYVFNVPQQRNISAFAKVKDANECEHYNNDFNQKYYDNNLIINEFNYDTSLCSHYATFKIFCDSSIFKGNNEPYLYHEKFLRYLEKVKVNDYKIGNISFGSFSKLFDSLYEDKTNLLNPIGLSKKFNLFISEYNNYVRDECFPKKNELTFSVNKSIKHDEEKNDWIIDRKIIDGEGNAINNYTNLSDIDVDNKVFRDFIYAVDYVDNISYRSLFLSDLYYDLNKIPESKKEIRNSIKAFLFLQTLYTGKNFYSFNKNYQSCLLTDLLFYGGCVYIYDLFAKFKLNGADNDIKSVKGYENKFVYISKKYNRFVQHQSYGSYNQSLVNFLNDDGVTYGFIGLTPSSVRNEMLNLFQQFVYHFFGHIIDECELKIIKNGEEQYITDIDKVITDLDRNQSNIIIWDKLKGKIKCNSNGNNTQQSDPTDEDYFLDNFVGHYLNFNTKYNKLLLLNEDKSMMPYTQVELINMYTRPILVGSMVQSTVGRTVNKESLKLSIDEQYDNFKLFLENYFNKINEIIQNNDEEEVIEEETSIKENRDFFVPIYNYLRNMWDKWLCYAYVDKKRDADNKNPFSVEKFFNNFLFIDSFYVNTFNRIHINCEILKNIYDGSPWEANLFKFLGDIASKHHCMFYAMADFIDLGDEMGFERMNNMFKPIPYNNINPSDLRNNNHFVVMFTYPPSENLNIQNNDYVYDGFDVYSSNDGKYCVPKIFDNNGNLDEINENYSTLINGDRNLYLQRTRYGYNVPSFGVSFSRQDNNIFKNINIGMTNPVQTEQSIKALYDIVSKAKGNDRKICFYGQDLYPVFSNMSYTCDIEMLGNAQISPLMYFQLFNVPMFRGAYMIYSVSHNIQPGNMITKFSGMKMSKRAIPYPAGWYAELEFDSDGELLDLNMNNDNMINNEVNTNGYSTQSVNNVNITNAESHDGLIEPIHSNYNSLTGLFYENRSTHKHMGVDIPVKMNTEVLSPWDGKITFKGYENGSGNTIKILHNNNLMTVYRHLNKYANVEVDDTIRSGQVIGYSGGLNCEKEVNYSKFQNEDRSLSKSECINRCRLVHGISGGPHLHFEVRKKSDNKWYYDNPLKYKFHFGITDESKLNGYMNQINDYLSNVNNTKLEV